jgi:hypothetical protein
MRRRDFLKSIRDCLGILAVSVGPWPAIGLAQTLPKRALIGFLGASSKSAGGRYYQGFQQGMRERGYREGIDYMLAERYADGQVGKLRLRAEELVSVRPESATFPLRLRRCRRHHVVYVRLLALG